MEVTKERMLLLISTLLSDRGRVCWSEDFLSVAYDVVDAEPTFTPLKKLAAMLDLCMAQREFYVKIVNWVRRAAGAN